MKAKNKQAFYSFCSMIKKSNYSVLKYNNNKSHSAENSWELCYMDDPEL